MAGQQHPGFRPVEPRDPNSGHDLSLLVRVPHEDLVCASCNGGVNEARELDCPPRHKICLQCLEQIGNPNWPEAERVCPACVVIQGSIMLDYILVGSDVEPFLDDSPFAIDVARAYANSKPDLDTEILGKEAQCLCCPMTGTLGIVKTHIQDDPLSICLRCSKKVHTSRLAAHPANCSEVVCQHGCGTHGLTDQSLQEHLVECGPYRCGLCGGRIRHEAENCVAGCPWGCEMENGVSLLAHLGAPRHCQIHLRQLIITNTAVAKKVLAFAADLGLQVLPLNEGARNVREQQAPEPEYRTDATIYTTKVSVKRMNNMVDRIRCRLDPGARALPAILDNYTCVLCKHDLHVYRDGQQQQHLPTCLGPCDLGKCSQRKVALLLYDHLAKADLLGRHVAALVSSLNNVDYELGRLAAAHRPAAP